MCVGALMAFFPSIFKIENAKKSHFFYKVENNIYCN